MRWRTARCRYTATGMQVRDWLYVDDHCRAIRAVLENGRDGEIYNIGGNRSLPNLEVIRQVAGAYRQAREPDSIRARPARARPPLCPFERETDARNGLAAAGGFRERTGADDRLVSRECGVGGARTQRRLSRLLRAELWRPGHCRTVAAWGDGQAEAQLKHALPMRVAIEATALSLSSGGLQRYTAELSVALARGFPEEEYVLVSDQPFRVPVGAPGNLRRGGGPRNFLERWWWLYGLPRELGRLEAGLVHGPDFAVPYLYRRPSVMTVHDLSPWMDPHWHHAADRVKRRTPVLLKLGLATMIVTPSESVRAAAIDRFGLHPSRVVAVPEAAPSWMRPAPEGPRPAEPSYFLFAGTLEPRKNLPLLVEAWREVRRRHAVGPGGGWTPPGRFPRSRRLSRGCIGWARFPTMRFRRCTRLR